MKRLIIVVDVENVDPTTNDPYEVAELVLNDDNEALADYFDHVGWTERNASDAPDFTHVAASWIDGDPLRSVLDRGRDAIGGLLMSQGSVSNEAIVDALRDAMADDWSTS